MQKAEISNNDQWQVFGETIIYFLYIKFQHIIISIPYNQFSSYFFKVEPFREIIFQWLIIVHCVNES